MVTGIKPAITGSCFLGFKRGIKLFYKVKKRDLRENNKTLNAVVKII
jgi:hypothetical protein